MTRWAQKLLKNILLVIFGVHNLSTFQNLQFIGSYDVIVLSSEGKGDRINSFSDTLCRAMETPHVLLGIYDGSLCACKLCLLLQFFFRDLYCDWIMLMILVKVHAYCCTRSQRNNIFLLLATHTRLCESARNTWNTIRIKIFLQQDLSQVSIFVLRLRSLFSFTSKKLKLNNDVNFLLFPNRFE